MPVLADQVLPIPYLEGGLVGAMEHKCRRGLAWAMEEALVGAVAVAVAVVVVGGDGVAIMVTPGGKFTTLLRR